MVRILHPDGHSSSERQVICYANFLPLPEHLLGACVWLYLWPRLGQSDSLCPMGLCRCIPLLRNRAVGRGPVEELTARATTSHLDHFWGLYFVPVAPPRSCGNLHTQRWPARGFLYSLANAIGNQHRLGGSTAVSRTHGRPFVEYLVSCLVDMVSSSATNKEKVDQDFRNACRRVLLLLAYLLLA